MTDRDLPIDIEADARAVAHHALTEDGDVDITSEVAAAAGLRGVGMLEYRSGGVVAGERYATEVVRQCGLPEPEWTFGDGDVAEPGATVARVTGDLAAILRAERPLLNVLQRACGIASATRRYVDAVAGTACRVLHTRKTAPGLRGLDILSVLAGGGGLHRASLATEVLLKDNHWHALARRGLSLRAMCDKAKASGTEHIYIEVETEEQVREACEAGATRLLVDNQTPQVFQAWSTLAHSLSSGIEMEASGGITLSNVMDYARAGADYVSIGALTHSVIAADLAMEIAE